MSPRMVIQSLLLLCACSHAAFAQFIRETTDADRAALQTRVTTYTHPAGVRVTLIATVHVGEKSYYDAIRDTLSGADAVLHEGARVRSGGVAFDFARALGLEKQTAQLRLAGERFIRADADELDVRGVAAAPTSRRALADGLLSLERDPSVASATNAAYAIVDRNAIALQALRHRLARGDQHIILLYGAAHAPDLDKRLHDELGFRITQTSWISAFRI